MSRNTENSNRALTYYVRDNDSLDVYNPTVIKSDSDKKFDSMYEQNLEALCSSVGPYTKEKQKGTTYIKLREAV